MRFLPDYRPAAEEEGNVAEEDDSSEAVGLAGCLFDIVAHCKHIIVDVDADADAGVDVDVGVDGK